MNVLTIVAGIILMLFVISGFHEGLIRKVFSVLSMVIASLLVTAMLPQVTKVLKENTPVYDMIVSGCENITQKQLENELTKSISESRPGKIGSLTREAVKYLLEQQGLSEYSAMVDMMSEEELRKVVDRYLPYVEDTLGVWSGGLVLDNLTQIQQTELIRGLPVPSFIQQIMLKFNNSEGYRKLGVTGFGGYLTHFIADVILNIVSFLVTLVLVNLLLFGIMWALRLFSKFPVLRVADRLGGMLFGLFQGVLILWIALMVLSLFSGTSFGIRMLDMVEDSALLRPIYNTNLFLVLISRVISGIL